VPEKFEWAAFVTANNSFLLNNVGNFVNRLIKFVMVKFGSTVPEFETSYTDDTFDFPAFICAVNQLLQGYVTDMDAIRLRSGLERAVNISSCGNNLLQYRLDNASLEAHPQRTHAVIGLGLNLCSLLASLFAPFMPNTANSIAKQLNVDLQLIPDTYRLDVVKPGHKIGRAAYLFTRIDEKKISEWKEQYGGTSESRAAEAEAKQKKAEQKERDKARRAARRAAKAAEAQAGPSNEAGAASKDGDAKAETVPETHTAATEEREDLPIREKPAEK